MSFKTNVFGLVVWAAAFAASAANWYVDAVNGNDDWDGTTPVLPAEGTAGPRRTLAAAMPLAGEGDTVYAAPGTYDQGEMWDSNCGVSNRVIVLRGRRLVATAGRKRTFITGKKSNELSSGFGPDSVRCVLLQGKSGDVAGGIVKGFTITGGYTFTNEHETVTSCGGGVASFDSSSIDTGGLAVDCDITGNNTSQRGANVFHVTLLRCRMGTGNRDLDFYQSSKAIDSLFENNFQLYRNIKFYNCTFTGAKRVYSNSSNDSLCYNCLFLNPSYDASNSARMKFYDCQFRQVAPTDDPATNATLPTFSADCRFALTTADLALKLSSLRPTGDSSVAGAGDKANYFASTNGWLRAWQDEFNGTDYFGRPRLTDNQLDVGCGQHASDDLFPIYVDAVHGDDANGGWAPDDAVKTLKTAFEISDPGDTVYAAEGVYDEGVVQVAGQCDCRVSVLPGRRLVATGRRAQTVIMGALATDAGGPNLNGCGSNAVRCVYFPARDSATGDPSGIVRGFTLKNGRTHANFKDGQIVQSESGDTEYDSGGGASSYGSSGGGLLVDCDFVDCGSACRGPNARNVTLYRCRVYPSKCGGLDCFQTCRLIDTYYANPQRAYQDIRLYNTTVTSPVKVYSLGSQQPSINSLYLGTGGDTLVGERMHYTNCISCAAWPTTSPSMADYEAATCRFGVPAGDVACYGMRPWRRSIVLGAGSVAAYLTCTNGWSDAWRDEFDLKDCAGNPRIVDGKISVGCCEYAELYVNATTGDDANDGLTPATAKKTLVGALDNDWDGGTVNIAAGVYDEGTTNVLGSLTRALVPYGWAFEGAGRGQTVIKGLKSAENADGLGADAVRCAVISNTAYLRGVTLQDGRTPTTSIAGGAYVYGGALVDCEVTGCKGGTEQSSDFRGSAVYGRANGWMIGCHAHANGGSFPVFWISMANSVIDCGYYGDCPLLNDWIEGDAKVTGWNYTLPACNCVILKGVGRGYAITNCVIGEKFTYSTDINHPENNFTNNGYDKATCVIDASKSALQASVDAKYRPLNVAGSLLLDRGSRLLYDQSFPAAWRMFKDDDFGGGARVLNGEIDIGAGEHDWREDFADVIHPRQAEVTEAGDNVTIANGALVFSPGDTLSATWTSTRIRWAEFTAAVPDGGTLTVTLGGVALEPVDGVYRFRLTPGANELHFAYAGTGTATAGDFAVNGFQLILR